MDKLTTVRNKILSAEVLKRQLAIWNFLGKKIVFTNGCFDIVHRGHIEYLGRAASLGDVLVIGLNTDRSVRRLKGKSRPIQDEQTRALILASISFIDCVVLFEEQTPYELIKLVQPDILVKGADYKPEEIVGYDIVSEKGGQVITVELTKGHSTTDIIGKINLG